MTEVVVAVVKDVRFTRGGFGEQRWTFEKPDGTSVEYAMWLNFHVPDRWPKVGETVELRELPNRFIHTGGGGGIHLGPCADLISIRSREVACPT